jgi:hypothetical protein
MNRDFLAANLSSQGYAVALKVPLGGNREHKTTESCDSLTSVTGPKGVEWTTVHWSWSWPESTRTYRGIDTGK